MVSFDVVNLYSSIPVRNTLDIIRSNMHENNHRNEAINPLMNLIEMVVKQNFFTFNNNFYTMNEGLPMGSPLSTILSEIFMNTIEAKINEHPLRRQCLHNLEGHTPAQ